MKDEEKKPEKGPAKKRIRLRLNYRTIVTVKSDAALKAWLARYPEATVLED
jgi:hypothetical protein